MMSIMNSHPSTGTFNAFGTTARVSTRVSSWRIFLLEARMEFLRLLRTPSFVVPTLAFPILFYLLFGVALGDHHPGAARQLLARFMVFGIMAPALFGLGMTVALDRDRGLLQLKRALPMPPGAYLASKVAVAMLFAAIISSLLMLLAATLGQVVLVLMQWWALFVLAVMGVVPFCSLGLLVGTLTKAQAAPAILNLIYLPMSFLTGLLIPLPVLPHGLAQVAPFLPAYHLAQMALAVIAAGPGGALSVHVLVLICMAAVFFLLARQRLRRLG